jgi:hypothetical protein
VPLDKGDAMAVVGDRVQVPSKRVGQTPREGVVTGVSGALLRVTWSGGEESTIFPSMGSLVVVGRVRAGAKKSASKKAAGKKAPSKKAPPKKAVKASKPVARTTKSPAKSSTKKIAKKRSAKGSPKRRK